MLDKENGAPILPDENAPIAVNDSTFDVSILSQKALDNQGSTGENSNNAMENTDAGNGSAGTAGSGVNGNKGNTVAAAPQKQAAPYYQGNVRTIIKRLTEIYLKHIHKGQITILGILTKGMQISDDLLTTIQDRLNDVNKRKGKGEKKLTIPSTLPPSVAVSIIMQTDAVRVLKLNADNYRIIIKHYNEDGSFSGIWELLPEYNKEGNYGILNSLVNELIGGDAPPHVMAQAVNALRSEMLNRQKNGNYVVEPGWDPDLVPFYNGVYNGRDKTFMEYNDPAYEATYGHMYWLNKMDTNFTWTPSRLPEFDPIDFICSLFDDTQEGRASFQLVLIFAQFMLRRYLGLEGNLMNFINKSGIADGKNGKSTLADMLVGIISHSANEAYSRRKDRKLFFENGHKVEKIPIDKWGKDYQIANNIVCAWILFSDEISGKKAVEETGFLKNISRHQAVQLRPMYHEPFSYVFNGTLLHLQNESTQLATKDGASFTHRIDIAFEKDFSGAQGDPKIKTFFTACEETWEYLSNYLMTQVEWYEDYPKELLNVVAHNTEDVREANVPALSFLNEVMDGLRECKFIPTPVLYELYRNWAGDTGYSYKVTDMTLQSFERYLQMWIRKHRDEYAYVEERRRLSTKDTYDVIDYKTGNVIQKTELGLLVDRIHPAIQQYGISHTGEKSKYIDTAFSYRGTILGSCDLLTVNGRFSHFVEIKDRITGYEETTGSVKGRANAMAALKDITAYKQRAERKQQQAEEMRDFENSIVDENEKQLQRDEENGSNVVNFPGRCS